MVAGCQAVHAIVPPPTVGVKISPLFQVGFGKIGNSTQWLKAFERSCVVFLPFLSLGGNVKVGKIDT